MSRRLTILLLVALVLAACGGGDDGADLGSAFDGVGDAAKAESVDSDAETSDSDAGSLENPIPEASGTLDPNSIRIGGEVWSPPHPSTTGQCVVQAADDPVEESAWVWGGIDSEGTADFRFSYEGSGSVEGQLFGNTMHWMSGERDGSELSFVIDFDAAVISGSGLFYNGHTNSWAYGSFSFNCADSG